MKKLLKPKSHLKWILLIILIIFIISILTMADFLSNKNKDKNKNENKVIETKTFSEIPEFSFEYPIFKEWDVKRVEKKTENEYVIFLNWPQNIGNQHIDFEVAPQITIIKIQEQKIPDFEIVLTAKENKLGSVYEYVYFPSNYIKGYEPKTNYDALHFYKEDSLNGVLIKIPIGTGYGFSREVFSQKIIETFRFS